MCVAAWPRGSRGWAAHDDNPSKQHSKHCQQFCRTLPCLCRAEICHQRFSSSYSMSEGLCNIYTFNIFCPDLILNTKAKIRIASAVTSFSLEVHKIDSVFTVFCPPPAHHNPPPAAVCSIFGIQHSATSLSADRSKTWVQASCGSWNSWTEFCPFQTFNWTSCIKSYFSVIKPPYMYRVSL